MIFPRCLVHTPRATTTGIGSDHVDLQAAIDRGITVAEVTYSNSISVSEHVVMMILGLVRNYIPSYQWVVKGGWNIADCVTRSYDVEGMNVGTVAAGRIGLAVLRRLKPFDMHLHYYDRHRLLEAVEKELNLVWHPNVEDMVKVCDVVTINAPLHPETENLFNDKLLAKIKRGAYLVNTARGKICDRDAIVRALESGQLGGYAGDVWFPQPAPKDHPWRTMPHHGMTPHISSPPRRRSTAARLVRAVSIPLKAPRAAGLGARDQRGGRSIGRQVRRRRPLRRSDERICRIEVGAFGRGRLKFRHAARAGGCRASADRQDDATSPPTGGGPAPGDKPTQTPVIGQPPPPAEPRRPRRFYAKVALDPNRPTPQVSNIAQSILAELDRVRGAKITLTLDIDAEAASGFPEDVENVVRDNARDLRFTDFGFEEE